MHMVLVCFDLLSFQTCCDVVVLKADDAETAPAFRLALAALVKHTTRRSTRTTPARPPTTAPIAAALT